MFAVLIGGFWLLRVETTDCAEEGRDVFVVCCRDGETACDEDVAVEGAGYDEADENGEGDACCFA